MMEKTIKVNSINNADVRPQFKVKKSTQSEIDKVLEGKANLTSYKTKKDFFKSLGI